MVHLYKKVADIFFYEVVNKVSSYVKQLTSYYHASLHLTVIQISLFPLLGCFCSTVDLCDVYMFGWLQLLLFSKYR